MPSPYSSSQTSNTPRSSDRRIDAILSGTQWGNGKISTQPFEISYSLPGSASTFAWFDTNYSDLGEENSWSPLGTNAQDIFRQALTVWSNVANLKFVEVADNSTTVGDIRIAFTNVSNGNAYAWAYEPDNYATAGDIWINTDSKPDYADTLANSIGGYALLATMHELGHTLGLKHTFEAPTRLPYAEDWMGYSVMSYSVLPGQDVGDVALDYYPTTPSIYDILAIQYLYGANTRYHSGDNTYQYSESEFYYQTLWDAGGTDSISYAGNLTDCQIDLREGLASHLGRVSAEANQINSTLARDNVWIAFGAVIENAIGGAGNDYLQGNDVDNRLTGGKGADTLVGADGADVLVWQSSRDSTVTEPDMALDFSSQDKIELTAAAELRWFNDPVPYQAALQPTLDSIRQNPAYQNSLLQFSDGFTSYLYVNGDGIGDGKSFDETLIRFGNNARITATQFTGFNVLVGNQPPYLKQALADQQRSLGQPFSLTLSVNSFGDIDSPQLTYSAQLADGSALPDWLSFDGENRRFSGQAPAGNPSSWPIKVSASDGEFSASDEFVLSLLPNTPPVLQHPLPDVATGVYQTRALQLALPANSFSDSDAGNTLSYEATLSDGSPLPAWLHFDNQRLIFSANLTPAQQGDWPVRISADDGLASVSGDFTLSINPLNPVLGSPYNDTLTGTAAADWINSAGGNDKLRGGQGDDVYLVDSNLAKLFEVKNQGNDSVESSVSYSLPKNVENLTLTGTLGSNAVGNELPNQLTGNDGQNILSGGDGNDTLFGGGSVDIFWLNSKLSSTHNVDTLVDFTPGEDLILLSRKIFKSIGSTFVAEDGLTHAPDAETHLFQDTRSATVYYDMDGDGLKSAMPILLVATPLQWSDFQWQ